MRIQRDHGSECVFNCGRSAGEPYPVTEHPFIPLKDEEGELLSPPQFEMEPGPEGKKKKKPNPCGLLGQALKAGYQSHYTVVDSEDIDTAFPTEFGEEEKVVSGELVVIESSQALPLFLVYYKAPSGKPGSGNTTGAAAAGSTASSSAGKFSC